MKQYRITSEHFVHQGETGDDNAVMHPDDLAEIKRLAGIVTEAEGGMYSGATPLTNTDNGPMPSPVGSLVSNSVKERRDLELEFHAKPGTDMWFIINFSKAREGASLRDQVERYLEKHPEYRAQPSPVIP